MVDGVDRRASVMDYPTRLVQPDHRLVPVLPRLGRHRLGEPVAGPIRLVRL